MACSRRGAPLWAQRAQDDLARTGGPAPPAGELTLTEQRIAQLVGEGKKNREVAEALFISVKTVEANLSRIFHKLGVRSRTELSRRIATQSQRVPPIPHRPPGPSLLPRAGPDRLERRPKGSEMPPTATAELSGLLWRRVAVVAALVAVLAGGVAAVAGRTTASDPGVSEPRVQAPWADPTRRELIAVPKRGGVCERHQP